MSHRLEAARALRLMGPDAKDAVPDLVKVLEQTDELEGGRELVIASADALGAMGRNARDARRILERQRSRSTTPDVVARARARAPGINTGDGLIRWLSLSVASPPSPCCSE